MTGLTFVLGIQLDFLLTAEYRFFKGNSYAGADITSLHWTITCSTPAASAAAKEVSENISKNISEIGAAEIKAAKTAATGTTIKGSVSELIILASFFRVA